MENLTEYCEDELSLRVYNDEFLYDLRHRKDIIDTLNEMFTFTEEQEKVLLEDLNEEEQDA